MFKLCMVDLYRLHSLINQIEILEVKNCIIFAQKADGLRIIINLIIGIVLHLSTIGC